MKTNQELKSLYETEQLKNGYSVLPVPGYYKFGSSNGILYMGKFPATASCLWKPLGSKQSDMALQVQIPLLPLLASECSDEQKRLLISSDLQQYVLVVKDVSTSLINDGKVNLTFEWQLRRLFKLITAEDLNAFLASKNGIDLIDGFLSDAKNHELYTEDEPEDYVEDLFDDDYDQEIDGFDDDDAIEIE